jgi:hypothetical protein
MNGVCDQEARDLAREALSRMNAHEKVCTERWTTSRATQVEVKAGVARVEAALTGVKDAVSKRLGIAPAGIIALLMGVIGFMGGHFH